MSEVIPDHAPQGATGEDFAATPFGWLEAVGYRIVWHPGPAIHDGEEWADLPIRRRTDLIADFYFRLKVKNILLQPGKAKRREMLWQYRQMLVDKAKDGAGIADAHAAADRLEAAVRAAWIAQRVLVLEPA